MFLKSYMLSQSDIVSKDSDIPLNILNFIEILWSLG